MTNALSAVQFFEMIGFVVETVSVVVPIRDDVQNALPPVNTSSQTLYAEIIL